MNEHERDVADYLGRLRPALRGIGRPDRDAILDEIGSHLTECAGGGTEALAAALERLGPPHALARRYAEEYALAGAAARGGPGRLPLAVLNRGARGAAALATGLATAFLYVLAASLAVVAAAKPVAPSHVGAWRTGEGWQAGLLAEPPAVPDVLGWWAVPLAVAGAAACVLLATALLRGAGWLRLWGYKL